MTLGFLVYLFPSVVAFRRDSRHRWTVLGINIVAGATFLGWILALYLATRRRRPVASTG
ncbi:superinfection immunity protein [Streptomyces sp. NPDC093589]|uniref:superinfection immunity protein n=1 Tax=Streptomyces sp. NPDC093589 TaxID=3366043 RepID=UPI0037F60E11